MDDDYDEGSWMCPECHRQHNRAHYAHPGQVDMTLEPGAPGRVRFNRVKKGDEIDDTMTMRKDLIGIPGPKVDTDGVPSPRFCPHCGYIELDRIIIVRQALSRRSSND